MKNKRRTLAKDVTATHGKTGGKELQELSHAAVPGYRSAFYIVFALGAAYLTMILLTS